MDEQPNRAPDITDADMLDGIGLITAAIKADTAALYEQARLLGIQLERARADLAAVTAFVNDELRPLLERAAAVLDSSAGWRRAFGKQRAGSNGES